VGSCPSHQKKLYFCHLSTNKWVPHVRLAVNWLQICDLSELQLACRKMVDFGCQNVKLYHLINFA
jgi:hypothetical protein